MINESMIIAIATILFVCIVFRPAKRFLIGTVDEYAHETVNNLKEAEKLHAQARKMLLETQRQYDEAKVAVDAIIEKAKVEAEMLIAEANDEVMRITTKKSEIAMARIAQQEQNIMDYLKEAIVSDAISNVHEIVANELDINMQLNLVQENVRNLSKKKMH